MSSVYHRRKTKKEIEVDKEVRQMEFDRGVAEWREWIRDQKSKDNVIARKRRSDDDDKAYFLGVLTGAKRAGFLQDDKPGPVREEPEFFNMLPNRSGRIHITIPRPDLGREPMMRRKK